MKQRKIRQSQRKDNLLCLLGIGIEYYCPYVEKTFKVEQKGIRNAMSAEDRVQALEATKISVSSYSGCGCGREEAASDKWQGSFPSFAKLKKAEINKLIKKENVVVEPDIKQFVYISIVWKYLGEFGCFSLNKWISPVERKYSAIDIQEYTIAKYVKMFDDLPKHKIEYAYIIGIEEDETKTIIKKHNDENKK